MLPFKNLVHDFGEQLNVNGIEADEQGYIALSFDAQTIHLQYDEEQDEVLVFTRLTEIEPNRLADICLMILGANILWQGTKGATFSVEPNSKTVLLADRKTLSFFNVNRLNDWLEQFLNMAQYWNERLITANAGGNLLPEAVNTTKFFSKNWMRS
jgi:hypothetical protein